MKTHTEFERELNYKYGDDFVILSPYRGCNQKMKFKHRKCNNIIHLTPSSVLHGSGNCKFCANKKITKTTNEYRKEIIDLVGDEYKALGRYKNNHTEINMLHVKCNRVFKMKPNNFLHNNSRCPYCAEDNRINNILNKINENYYINSSYYKILN